MKVSWRQVCCVALKSCLWHDIVFLIGAPAFLRLFLGPQRCKRWSRGTRKTRAQGKIYSILGKNIFASISSPVRSTQWKHSHIKLYKWLHKNTNFPPQLSHMPHQTKNMQDLTWKRGFPESLKQILFALLYFKRKWYMPVCNASDSL